MKIFNCKIHTLSFSPNFIANSPHIGGISDCFRFCVTRVTKQFCVVSHFSSFFFFYGFQIFVKNFRRVYTQQRRRSAQSRGDIWYPKCILSLSLRPFEKGVIFCASKVPIYLFYGDDVEKRVKIFCWKWRKFGTKILLLTIFVFRTECSNSNVRILCPNFLATKAFWVLANMSQFMATKSLEFWTIRLNFWP